ncbi:hypothetical protein BASA81_006857 [Batrachochytrium salamandrivorans]|nr:hypothetical protein BASA81_006857 [Batrachochytrium salamandrivorans]
MESVTADDRLAFKSILAHSSPSPGSALVAPSAPEPDNLESGNPLFTSEKLRLSFPSGPSHKAPENEMGGNFGDLDEDEDEDMVGRWKCFGPDRTCTRTGWRAFFRALQCPCARPKTLKTIKNPSELKTIRLVLPTPPAKNYRPDNVVITSKYTVWDFFPRAMALQFRRAVNVFYLVQVALLIVGYFFPAVFESPFTPFGTLLVLAFVLGVTLISEFKDDRGRHRQDAIANGKRVIKVRKGRKHQASTWGELLPGDYILLKNRELVPADVIVVETSNTGNGIVYIETSGIDGETNLKIRRSPAEFAKTPELELGNDLPQGILSYEEPNPFLSFSGSFTSSTLGGHSIPLGFENLILRGSEVRNTAWVLCVVVYAGHETKLVLSKRATPSKFSTMDYLINRIVALAVLQLVIMMAISLICLFVGDINPNTKHMWYFHYTDTTQIFLLPSGLAFALTFYVIYGNVVPIDLYVVMEVATGLQSWFLCRDLLMYDPVTNTPAGSKSTNLISEIGQVSHVFSDKTGTLTQNVMRLVGCSIGGKRFGVKVPDAVKHTEGTQFATKDTSEMDKVLGKRTLDYPVVFADFLAQLQTSREAAEFLLILAVCHTVVMDRDDLGQPRYNAEGPDEEALVKAAAALGMVLRSTNSNLYEVFDEHHKVLKSFKVLGVNGFNSDRKRMSVVVQDQKTMDYMLLLKGADSVVAERSRNMSPTLQNDLDAFAQVGLRTLLVAVKRGISKSQVDEWQHGFNEAKLLVGQAKADALDRIAEQFEQDLEVVGATAIEDALQEGVPETIQMLRQAQIKVWVLTGDKVDTAVNIGFSSQLLDTNMHQIYLDGTNTNELEAKLDEYLAALESVAKAAGITNPELDQESWATRSLALVLTGKSVEYLLAKQKGTPQSQQKLVSLANACSVVLACRVSPAQKALIVRASTQSAKKRGAKPVVSLAIGDGANDVPMIQEACIGVGISGKEGLQAVNSADFSIAQFRFLQRMLFVHGRWSYKRNATLILYDISPQTALGRPEAYDLGRLNLMLSTYKIVFAITVIEWVFGDTTLMGSYDYPFAYANVFLLFGVIVLYEHCTSGARRLFFPNVSERLMEVDRGHTTVGSGMKDFGGMAMQGVDHTVFVTAKSIKAALITRKQHAQVVHDDVQVEEMRRPQAGYVDSGPTF